MNKNDVQKRVLKDGKPLSLRLFSWDKKTDTFSSLESNLVVDFKGINGVTFNTGSGCTFNTGYGCTFDTGSYCTFDTRSGCTFETGYQCVVVRRDIFEVIKLKEGQKIKLNGYGVKGYKVIK